MSAQLAVQDLEVREWRKGDDAAEMAVIVFENKELHADWHFLAEDNVYVAIYFGHIVGFVAYRHAPDAVVVDELWCLHSKAGVRGLAALYEHLERISAQRAKDTCRTIHLGGWVAFNNPLHRAAVRKRGFKPIGEVITKEFSGVA